MKEIRKHIIENSNRIGNEKSIKNIFREIKSITKVRLEKILKWIFKRPVTIVASLVFLSVLVNAIALSKSTNSEDSLKPLKDLYKTRNNVSNIPTDVNKRLEKLERLMKKLDKNSDNFDKSESKNLEKLIKNISKNLNIN